MEDGQPARPDAPRTYPLATGLPSLGTPLLVGIIAGLFTISTLQEAAPELGSSVTWAIGLAVALAGSTLLSFIARWQTPDHVRLQAGALELARGPRAVRRVVLAKVAEVNELPTATGPVLLLSDDRQTLVLAKAQLVKERDFDEITGAIVEAVGAADPSGELGRSAARTGRMRETIAQQPVRVTPLLVTIIALASLVGFATLEAGGHPYPYELSGALSTPLLQAGERFRIFSYLFLHASGPHLVLAAAGLLWMGSFLEKLVGWERVVLAFVAGAAGGAAGHVVTTLPTAMLGATPGLFGLFGLLGAVAVVGRRRLPRALLPRRAFWVVTFLLGALLPFSIQGPSLVPIVTWIAHLAAMGAGFLLGLGVVAGRALPIREEDREEFRPFAWVAVAALGIGLFGGALHVRREHPDDDELVTRGLLTLPKGVLAAHMLNEVAYNMLLAPNAGATSWDHAERLSRAAIEQTDRQAPEILDTLAVARYHQGQVAEAKELIEEARRLTKDPRLLDLLERRLKDMAAGGELSRETN